MAGLKAFAPPPEESDAGAIGEEDVGAAGATATEGGAVTDVNSAGPPFIGALAADACSAALMRCSSVCSLAS